RHRHPQVGPPRAHRAEHRHLRLLPDPRGSSHPQQPLIPAPGGPVRVAAAPFRVDVPWGSSYAAPCAIGSERTLRNRDACLLLRHAFSPASHPPPISPAPSAPYTVSSGVCVPPATLLRG